MKFRLSTAIDSELLMEFFVRFSVLERSLKETNYLKKGPKGAAMADWDAFKTNAERKPDVLAMPEVWEAIEGMKALKLKKQYVNANRKAAWAIFTQKSMSDAYYAITLLMTVRNNLFHGSKWPADDVRNSEVLSAGLQMIEACLRFDAKVNATFVQFMKFVTTG